MASSGRTTGCTPKIRAGRLAKAKQFMEAARSVAAFADNDADVADAYVTLCVHAGIAAADVICCARLNVHAHGESHDDAVGLLGKADAKSAKPLRVLLGMKTKAGYSALGVNANDCKRAGRAAQQLVDVATELA